MKKIVLFSIALITFGGLCSAQTVTLTVPPHRDNQKSSVTQWIGMASITITYHGPDVHSPTGEDRKGHVWGELVPFGMTDPGFGTSTAAPWRAGSNEITTITLSHDVKIGGKDLKAGTYGLFLLPEKDKPWMWIFSRNSTSWGSYYYNPDEDVLRVEATPEECSYTEWLSFGFDDRHVTSAVGYLQWENKRVSFKVEVPNSMQLYADQMRAELTGYAGFNADNWLRNARFCLTNNINLEEALKWTDISMDVERFGRQKTFRGMQTKAELLTALKREAEADVVMKEAVALNPSIAELHSYGMSLLKSGKNDQAMSIFKLNRTKNNSDNYLTFVGLAYGYAAIGDKKSAIKNWNVVLKNIPSDQEQNAETFKAELKKLQG